VKINLDLVRNLPAAGCFNHSVRNAWSRGEVRRRTVGVISNLIGQIGRPAIRILSVGVGRKSAAVLNFKSIMVVGCVNG